MMVWCSVLWLADKLHRDIPIQTGLEIRQASGTAGWNKAKNLSTDSEIRRAS